jgi:hypothetical protein
VGTSLTYRSMSEDTSATVHSHSSARMELIDGTRPRGLCWSAGEQPDLDHSYNKAHLRASSSLLFCRMGTTMELLSLLATHRILKNDSTGNNGDDGDSGRPFFPYEYPIAAVSVAFFRLTLIGHDREPAELRWCFAALLALLAYHGKSYELILAVELFSYVIVYWWLYVVRSSSSSSSCRPAAYSTWQRLAMIAGGALLCRIVAHAVTTGHWLSAMAAVTPSGVVYVIKYLFPIDELREAIDIMFKLTLEPDILAAMLHHLFFVTAHIQIGIGYLGIHFLTQQQARRNLLVRLDVDDAAPVKATNNDAPSTTSNGGNKKASTMIERAGSFKKGAAAFSTCREFVPAPWPRAPCAFSLTIPHFLVSHSLVVAYLFT